MQITTMKEEEEQENDDGIDEEEQENDYDVLKDMADENFITTEYIGN